jgi:MFS family permease
VNRSITAVLVGTFTLRFSTGLTGGLLVIFLARMPEHGGPKVGAFEVGALTAMYFLAELVLSPVFGVLSDRLGSHRVMQWGPVFGALAVIMTGVTTHPFMVGLLVGAWIFIWLAATRWLEGAAAGSSIPSILGYIAQGTSGDEALRGRAVARFEAATLAGLGIGIVAAGPLFDLIGPNGFFLNAIVYALSYVIYRWGVREIPREPVHASSRFEFSRYRQVLAGTHVWLLAPTWIALNAVVGAWASQPVFQLVRNPDPRFSDQLLNGGYSPTEVSVGLAAAMLVFLAGLGYWGNRFKRFRRTTIIGFGIAGGLVMMASVFAWNHSQTVGVLLQAPAVIGLLAGLFVLAGATPAALGLLADMTEGHPGDRGAVMGLYSVFLAIGQITGSLAGGAAAQWQGIDGLLLASLGLLLVAILPLRGLRATEHLLEPATRTDQGSAHRPRDAAIDTGA